MRNFNPGVWPIYSEECRREVNALLQWGGTLSKYRANANFGIGPQEGSQAWHLERELEKRFAVKHAIACNSGTAALHMALSALDLSGGEVVTSPYTFSATVAAILHAGGIPRFADVDPYNFCITKKTVKRVLTKNTKAILPVHLFGYFQDLSDLRSLGLPIVEDASQAVGAHRNGVWSGTVGAAGCYSFNGTKNLPCGEGGALVTNSARIAEKARLLMNHAENFGKDYVGYNYRMTELEACVAHHGLKALDERNRQRQELARVFQQVRYLQIRGKLYVPWPEPPESHVYYTYPFTLSSNHRSEYSGGGRKKFISDVELLGLKGWISGGYITPPIHHYAAFRKYAHRNLPIVDELSFKSLCLLSCVRPPATIEDMAQVARIINETLE